MTRRRLAEPSMRASAALLGDALGAAYLRAVLRIGAIEFRHRERLERCWRDHLEGRSRLVIAFRHAYGEEPQLLSRAFSALLPRLARREGRPLPGPVRARFVHGYEVPLWSGAFVRWLLPRSGAVPVYHVKQHKPSMDRIRSIIMNGPYPLALAPEGQISYRAEAVPRLEAGALRLGFMCAEELRARGRPERVVVLPISVYFRFDERGIGSLEKLVSGVEARLGIAPSGSPRGRNSDERKRALLDRLEVVDLALVGAAEGYYGIAPEGGASRDERLSAVMETALRRAEATFGLPSSGGTIDRVYRIRMEGWNRIYPERELSPRGGLERALEDRKAGEAWYAMRHMELVDLCYYLDSAYPRGEGLSFDRIAETAYSAADLASRLVGGDIRGRPSVLRRSAVVSAETPLDLSAGLGEYAASKRRAIDSALAELERRYAESIKERIDERRGDD